MTPARFILVVAVLALVAFAIGAALTQRNQDAESSPPKKGFAAWIGDFAAERQRVPDKDLTLTVDGRPEPIPDGRSIHLSDVSSVAVLKIEKNADMKVRLLLLKIDNSAPRLWTIQFQAEPAASDDGVRMVGGGPQTLFSPAPGKLPDDGQVKVPVGPSGGSVQIRRTLPGRSPLVISLQNN